MTTKGGSSRIYHCYKCERDYKYFRNFKVHQALVHYRTRLIGLCKMCLQPFTEMKLLIRHTCKKEASVNVEIKQEESEEVIKPRKILKKRKKKIRSESDVRASSECQKCGKEFPSFGKLSQHFKMSKCGEFKNLVCYRCGKTFGNQAGYTYHMRHKTSCSDVHKCVFCLKEFSTKSVLRKHLITHTKEKNFECSKCGEKFLYRSYLVDHCRRNEECSDGCVRRILKTSVETNPNFLQCEYCGKKGFPTYYAMRIHVRMHDTVFPCKVCGNTYSRLQGLKEHELSNCFGSVSCSFCGRVGFKSKLDLHRHMKEHRPESNYMKDFALPTAIKCDSCNKTFTRRDNMLQHKRTKCAGDKICEFCGKTDFKFKRDFLKHVIEEHNANFESEDTDLTCRTCYTTFMNNKQLIDHQLTCSTQDVGVENQPKSLFPVQRMPVPIPAGFKCDKCDKIVNTSRQLREHVRTVHCVKNPCQYCGKYFSQRVMAMHVRTHTGEKPYSCTKCGKSFKSTSNLNYHRNKQKCSSQQHSLTQLQGTQISQQALHL